MAGLKLNLGNITAARGADVRAPNGFKGPMRIVRTSEPNYHSRTSGS
ncbi:MAG: hypothetical protein LBE25_13495 [Arthrobacter sp.]|jgi:hypothetical protein|nr:hypothetical protein [Arthrobacter sp.]